MTEIAFCKIYPPIGIARLGDSKLRDGWFLSPEFSDDQKKRPKEFTFRDENGRIKRQAARFRVYAFDKNGSPIQELTSKDAKITWSVELSNKKASWFAFRGAKKALAVYNGEPNDPTTGNLPDVRNAGVGEMVLKKDGDKSYYLPDEKRIQFLEIHGGAKKISGENVCTDENHDYKFVGKFKEIVTVELGEVRTDDVGRLIVLGGKGHSDAVDEHGKSIRDMRFIRNYANNNDWHDDVSDGPVKVEVLIEGKSVKVKGDAWVICTVPDFAPDIDNL
ncbi:MAG TPA: LodA/GoxA family CTQ-dependent oxidase, partial [Mucilaginibacter sp.]